MNNLIQMRRNLMQARRMVRRPAVVLAGILALSITSGLLSGCGSHAVPPSPVIHSKPSHTALLKANGLDGRVALIQFGQAGCPMSGDGFLRMVRMNRDKTIANLSYLRVDLTGNKEQADEYFKANPPGFGVVRDDNGTWPKAFNATAIPSALLVDKFGRVRYSGKFPDERKLVSWVQELADQKTDAGSDVTLFGIESADFSGLPAATKLPDLSGLVKPLHAYTGSKGLLVVFVDVSCPYAGAAIGDLPKVGPTMAALGISTVVINISDPQPDVLETYAKRPTGTPVLYDVTDATKENWRIEQVPTVVLFGADGKSVYRSGAVWKDLAAATEKALGLKQGTVTFTVEGTGMG
jgi:hypothetical protein